MSLVDEPKGAAASLLGDGAADDVLHHWQQSGEKVLARNLPRSSTTSSRSIGAPCLLFILRVTALVARTSSLRVSISCEIAEKIF